MYPEPSANAIKMAVPTSVREYAVNSHDIIAKITKVKPGLDREMAAGVCVAVLLGALAVHLIAWIMLRRRRTREYCAEQLEAIKSKWLVEVEAGLTARAAFESRLRELEGEIRARRR